MHVVLPSLCILPTVLIVHFTYASWQPVKGSNETLKEVRFDSSDQLVGPAGRTILTSQLIALLLFGRCSHR